jgi:histidyl-tRNA synthetase
MRFKSGYFSLRTQIEEANSLKAKVTLILGKKEIMDETILMRDMESGVQEIVAQKKIKEKLDKKIIRKVGVIYG